MSRLCRFRGRAFGVVIWKPPQWLSWPREHRALAAGMLIVAAGLWPAWHWYQHRPQPHRVAGSVSEIPVTPLQKRLHPADLRIHFEESVAPLDLIGKAVTSGITMTPPTAGNWRWGSDRDLCFHPDNDWPADTEYHIALEHRAVARHVLLEKYDYDTRTPVFSATINSLSFYQDPKDATMKKVVTTLEFSHAIAPGELEKHLTLAMLGDAQVFPKGAPRFAVELDMHNRIAYVHTPKLTLPEREDFMKLLIDREMPTTQGGARLATLVSKTVKIPNNLSFFRIDAAEGTTVNKADGEPEQFVLIKTTAEALPEEVAKGLEIYLLPHRPAPSPKEEGKEEEEDDTEDANQRPPEWKSPSEIDASVLQKATRIPFTLVPAGRETSRLHTFKIKLESTGSLLVRVKRGTKAVGDFALSEDYNAMVQVPLPSPEIRIEGKGGVLALNGERKLSIVSRGVAQIEYTISRIPADQINHLVSQTEGDFENPAFKGGDFDETDMARIDREKQVIANPGRLTSSYSTFDFTNHLHPAADGGSPLQGLFFLDVKAWDPATKKYLENVSARRFILVTDAGILVKANADESRDVYVEALGAGTPLAGATVEILARNGVPAASGTTDAAGHVNFPAFGELTKEKAPVAIVVRNGENDVSFIPYEREDRRVNFSRFDTGGNEITSGETLDAFVFTERGVYRPADEIHIGYAVKQSNWGGNLAGLPLEEEVVNPRDVKALVKRIHLPPGGFGELTYRTEYESPTGEYTINLYLVRDGKRDTLLGSTTAMVKEFLPDKMKIAAHFSAQAERGWISPEEVSAAVTLQNLYGTPAAERRITGRINLNPAGFHFEGYEGYSFFDRLRDRKPVVESESDDLGEQTSDEKGAVNFDLNLERFANATYSMTFYTEGFEADGGRSVATDIGTLVSPLPYVVGHRSDGDLSYVKMTTGQTVSFVALDHAVNRIAIQNLQLKLTERTYLSVLTQQKDSTYAYESIPKDQVIRTEAVSLPAEGWKWKLPAERPGTYLAELRNDDGERVAAFWYTVVGTGDTRRPLDRNAELSVKLDRKSYASGDEIEASIVSPYTGSGLITIERDKVFAQQWFKAEQTNTVQKIRVPEGLDGTGYVNVSFIRALDSREIYMSPLSYGVAPFEANREKRHVAVSLSAARETRPGEPLQIGYKADRPCRMVVFAVDEGILQVTGFTTPDPLEHFFTKQALTVRTSQIMDLLLPEFSLLRAAATGGDGEGRQLNPFRRVTEKPVVFWSGIVDADATERTVTYQVPDYFSGNLKIMAVAIAPDAVGSADMATLVRGPFVITPGVPVFVAPGDQFEVGVTVANNVQGSGSNAQVTVRVEPSEALELVSARGQAMAIPEGREKTVTFVVRAREKLGGASLLFHASAAGQESKLQATLSVRPPVALMTDVRGGNFTGQSVEWVVERRFRPEYRALQAVLSPLPLGLAHGLDAYLQHYPNGCSEQLSSGAFCRLLLADEADFGLHRAEVAEQLEHTFQVLRSRQNDQGAFGYWGTESGNGSNALNAYVMNFLVEAKAAGFAPPVEMFQAGLRHLQKIAGETPKGVEEERSVAQAIYLLTREEVITTNYILNLRDHLGGDEQAAWRRDLTGVYLAGAYALLKQDGQADELISGYRMGRHEARDCSDFHSPLGMDAQYVAMVARHFPSRMAKVSAADFAVITDPIGRGEFSTLSAAYAVLALKSYSHSLALTPPRLTIREFVKDQWREIPGKGQLLKRVDFSDEARKLSFAVEPRVGGPGAYYQAISTGYELGAPGTVIKEGMEIYREYRDGQNQPVDTAKMGEPLTVVLRVRSLNGEAITNVAIVDLLPGGFELAKSSLEPGQNTHGCDYVDVREDRVLFYRTVTPRAAEIRYQIKADNRGKFTVPPVFAESMYDRGIKARGVGGTLSVTDAP